MRLLKIRRQAMLALCETPWQTGGEKGKIAYLKKYRQFSLIKTVVRLNRSFSLIRAAMDIKALYTTNRNNMNSKTVAEIKVELLCRKTIYFDIRAIHKAHSVPPLMIGHPGSGKCVAAAIIAPLLIVLTTRIHRYTPMEAAKRMPLKMAT